MHHDIVIEGEGNTGENIQLHVLDLPHPTKRPSAEALIKALDLLALEPPSFEKDSQQPSKVHPEGVPEYLTRVVASPLHWIDIESQREKIWELASQRLAERSGRTGMGSMDRDFTVRLAGHDEDLITFRIHEPALTGDNLGLKTWGSSYAIANELVNLGTYFQHPAAISSSPKLPQPPWPSHFNTLNPCANVLELGAGTGLLGMAFAAFFETMVTVTDLPEIVPNLQRNVEMNAEALQSIGLGPTAVTVGVLDWNKPDELGMTLAPTSKRDVQPKDPSADTQSRFKIILAADPIYSPSHPILLVDTIRRRLDADKDARVLIGYPLRGAYQAQVKALVELLLNQGPLEISSGDRLKVIAEGRLSSQDDWKEGEEITVEYNIFGF